MTRPVLTGLTEKPDGGELLEVRGEREQMRSTTVARATARPQGAENGLADGTDLGGREPVVVPRTWKVRGLVVIERTESFLVGLRARQPTAQFMLRCDRRRLTVLTRNKHSRLHRVDERRRNEVTALVDGKH